MSEERIPDEEPKEHAWAQKATITGFSPPSFFGAAPVPVPRILEDSRGRPYCSQCKECWVKPGHVCSVRVESGERTYDLVEVEPWCDGAIIGTAVIEKKEIAACADRRAMRRLVSAKLQEVGDALLAAMERVAGENQDEFYAARRRMREEYQQHRTGGLGVFELKQAESKEQE